MEKVVTFDFYRVEVLGNNAVAFGALVEEVGRSPNDATRNVDLPTGVYRLSRYAKRGNVLEGEVMRIRMTDLPVKARLSGAVTDIDLLDDEGVGEQTAFLYDNDKEVLVLQRNRTGVTPGAFAQYFGNVGGSVTAVHLQPALNADALERLSNMKDVSKLEFTVAPPSGAHFLDDSNKGVQETIELARYFQAPTITVTISRGHSSTYPARTKIGTVVNRLLSFGKNGNTVTKLRVAGFSTDDEPEAINFLLDQIQERASVSYNDKRRTMPYVPRRDAMREALKKWYDDI